MTLNVTYADYVLWLQGREPLIPEAEFGYWITCAKNEMSVLIINRCECVFAKNYDTVTNCAFALAETMYKTESAAAQQYAPVMSERNGEHSVTYMTRATQGSPQATYTSQITRSLAATGLLYACMDQCKTCACESL